MESSLRNVQTYDEFKLEYGKSQVIDDFKTYLRKLLDAKKMDMLDLKDLSHIPKSYFYQIVSGTRLPSRDKVLQLSFGLKLDLDETNSFLKKSEKQELYSRSKRDSIIMFAIINKKSIEYTNETLIENNQLPLF